MSDFTSKLEHRNIIFAGHLINSVIEYDFEQSNTLGHNSQSFR